MTDSSILTNEATYSPKNAVRSPFSKHTAHAKTNWRLQLGTSSPRRLHRLDHQKLPFRLEHWHPFGFEEYRRAECPCWWPRAGSCGWDRSVEESPSCCLIVYTSVNRNCKWRFQAKARDTENQTLVKYVPIRLCLNVLVVRRALFHRIQQSFNEWLEKFCRVLAWHRNFQLSSSTYRPTIE
jgi:hypothetical protein